MTIESFHQPDPPPPPPPPPEEPPPDDPRFTAIEARIGGRIGVAPTESGAEIRFTLPVYADAAES